MDYRVAEDAEQAARKGTRGPCIRTDTKNLSGKYSQSERPVKDKAE